MDDMLAIGHRSSGAPAAVLKKLARDMLRIRRAAHAYFGEHLLSEPAWNLMLVLYSRDGAARGLHIGSAADRAGVPRSTALRWLMKLEQHGFIARVPETHDRRAIGVELTSLGREMMQRSFIAAQFQTA